MSPVTRVSTVGNNSSCHIIAKMRPIKCITNPFLPRNKIKIYYRRKNKSLDKKRFKANLSPILRCKRYRQLKKNYQKQIKKYHDFLLGRCKNEERRFKKQKY